MFQLKTVYSVVFISALESYISISLQLNSLLTDLLNVTAERTHFFFLYLYINKREKEQMIYRRLKPPPYSAIRTHRFTNPVYPPTQTGNYPSLIEPCIGMAHLRFCDWPSYPIR